MQAVFPTRAREYQPRVADQSRYPIAPWELEGPAVIVIGAASADRVRRRLAAPTRLLALPFVGALTALVLADYREGSTLRYSELAGVVGPAVAGRVPGGWIETMLVDDDASLIGGRAIWNVPKEPAAFEWSGDPPHGVVVRNRDGEPVVSAQWSPPRIALPVPVLAPFLGTVDGEAVAGRLTGTLRGGPARVSVSVPPDSSLHALGVAGTRPGLVGHLRVRASGGRGPRGR
jgi:Acetoacetate decarboxylase (ADC)